MIICGLRPETGVREGDISSKINLKLVAKGIGRCFQSRFMCVSIERTEWD